MWKYANPRLFLDLAEKLLPWFAGLTVLLFAVGLYISLIGSPPDYQQGDSVRIMYVHVPAAWMALFCYVFMASASVVGLVWRHALADLAAKSTAPIGACFTFLALFSGSFWGKPMWGDWWVWDARVTSVLILFFLYLGYIALWETIEDHARAARAAAVLAIVGVIMVPIIKFSVDWWETLHQPASVLRFDGPTIHASLLWPLFTMALAFTFFFFTVLLIRMRTEIIQQRIRALRLAAIEE